MKVQRERQMIWADTGDRLSLDFTTLAELQKEVEALIEKYGPDARYSMQPEPYSRSDAQYPFLQVKRLENDEEYAARIANEERWAAQAEARDRAEYERLSKIFGANQQ